jgi:hypothetical protein
VTQDAFARGASLGAIYGRFRNVSPCHLVIRWAVRATIGLGSGQVEIFSGAAVPCQSVLVSGSIVGLLKVHAAAICFATGLPWAAPGRYLILSSIKEPNYVHVNLG